MAEHGNGVADTAAHIDGMFDDDPAPGSGAGHTQLFGEAEKVVLPVAPQAAREAPDFLLLNLPATMSYARPAFNKQLYSQKAEESELAEKSKQEAGDHMIRWTMAQEAPPVQVSGSSRQVLGRLQQAAAGVQARSNARIVKWSDGSYSLHVGDEAAVVLETGAGMAAGPQGFVAARQGARAAGPDADSKEEMMLETAGPITAQAIVRMQRSDRSSVLLRRQRRGPGTEGVKLWRRKVDAEELMREQIRSAQEAASMMAAGRRAASAGGGGAMADEDDGFDDVDLSRVRHSVASAPFAGGQLDEEEDDEYDEGVGGLVADAGSDGDDFGLGDDDDDDDDEKAENKAGAGGGDGAVRVAQADSDDDDV